MYKRNETSQNFDLFEFDTQAKLDNNLARIKIVSTLPCKFDEIKCTGVKEIGL